VEAAMIFPLVIAAVAAVVGIVAGMYQTLFHDASLHITLRNECGLSAQTVYRQERVSDYTPQKDRIGIRPVIRMEEDKEYRISILFKDTVIHKDRGRSYVIDEAELIRVRSIFTEESN
jgi:hypothetical protein